jgi:hypothetical protein
VGALLDSHSDADHYRGKRGDDHDDDQQFHQGETAAGRKSLNSTAGIHGDGQGAVG